MCLSSTFVHKLPYGVHVLFLCVQRSQRYTVPGDVDAGVINMLPTPYVSTQHSMKDMTVNYPFVIFGFLSSTNIGQATLVWAKVL